MEDFGVEQVMRSALYYPHTEVTSLGLLQTALLLWDHLEYIQPFEHFRPNYIKHPDCGRGMEVIGRGHYPSGEEKKEAHALIDDFTRQGLPSAFYIDAQEYRAAPDDTRRSYEIWPGKLLFDTWKLLERRGLVDKTQSATKDYVLTPSAGLTVMSILADCCAGSTRRRVTDRSLAYHTIAALLSADDDNPRPDDRAHLEDLVTTSLEIVDARAIPLEKLIAFREREERSSRALRYRYVDRIESYMKRLSGLKRKSDQDEVKRQFKIDMEDDLAALRDALRYSSKEVLKSREIITAGFAWLGVIAGAVTGLVNPLLGGFVTLSSAPTMIGTLWGARDKYRSSRGAILEKYPMAFLMEFKAAF